MRVRILSVVIAAAALASASVMAQAEMISVIINGTVSSNALTNSNSPYLGIPIGAAVTYTIPIDTTNIGNALPNETLYNIQKNTFVLAVAGAPTANGASGVGTFKYNDGGSGFYALQPPSIIVPGGNTLVQGASTVNFRATGGAGPNPFVNTDPADIAASHGTYFPTAAVFNGPPPSVGLDFNINVLNDSFQSQKVQIAINSFTITPEPSSLAMIGFGGALMLYRRRRHS
ncbi:MAG TPA: PEP-CTERM sorting domain-containing protein [Phycisphaerae bacterium]|nr:PEP-CTERM sorting domain-containing protein [Phycisphaerae bacterium]